MSETETSEPIKLSSSSWMRETGIRVMDDDGWRGLPKANLEKIDFETPITRAEFLERCKWSTVLRWPDPCYDERPEPPDEFVSRLADALKSEFGAQMGVGMTASDESWKRAARGIALKMRVERDVTLRSGARAFTINERISE